jgi:hypothetical protein
VYLEGKEGDMKPPPSVVLLAAVFLAAAACTGADAVIVGNTVMAASAAANPLIMREIDGIPGWKRQGPPERYTSEGLYGYIDGGAEIVLPYGFRELSVFRFEPATATAAPKEVVVEIYRMASGAGAFGLYSTKLEGGEQGWPGIKADNWISRGQANLVKSDYLVNILAPECTDREIGEFASALEDRFPTGGTVRPKGLSWLPREGMVPSSWRYIRGPVAAQNESPFLDGEFWGFGGDTEKGATVAYSGKYGTAPAISKLVIVELDLAPESDTIKEGVLALFNQYLEDVRQDGATIEGRNAAGRWFLFERHGAVALLVLGEPDLTTARARLEAAKALTPPRSPSRR